MRTIVHASLSIGLLALAHGTSRGVACDSSGCLGSVTAAGVVVNDVFRDANGNTAPNLPVYGTLFDVFPGCASPPANAGCAGQTLAPYDCPGQLACTGVANTFANASNYLNFLDRLFWNPCRLASPTPAAGCPTAGCIGDGTPGNYSPWDGVVFDLSARSNQVAVFAANDSGPNPCESLEVTVYFTSNPFAREVIANPAVSGVDETKWNRGVLKRVFTKGWIEVRPPDPAGHGVSCGDTVSYSVEMDSMVPIFALPSGAAMRYAAVIAGNDGLDFPSCTYHSSEAEVDAVAGLTETGRGICPGELTGVEGANGLAWAANKQDLFWNPLNGAVDFNVYRGALVRPWSYGHTCFASVTGTATVGDPTVPAPGGGAFYYLVSARNQQFCPGESAESLLGRDSSGAPTPIPFPCQ